MRTSGWSQRPRRIILDDSADFFPSKSFAGKAGVFMKKLCIALLLQFAVVAGAASTLYFPDYVVGSGWSVQLALGNVDTTDAAEVVVEVYDQDGAPTRDLFDSGSAFEIPPLGSRVLRSTGEGSLRRGWIQVRNPSGSVRGLLTYRHAGTGVEVGVEPVPPGKRFALFAEDSADVATGLAIFNPQPGARVEFDIRDQAGRNPLGEVLTRGGFQQQVGTLPEWYEGAGGEFLGDFRGLLFLRAVDGASFAPLGLRGSKRTGALSAVPVIPLPDPVAGKMYWADAVANRIQRANLDGSGVEDLITGLITPEALTLDLGSGKMYWTAQGTVKIQRANLDGSGVEDLVTGLRSLGGLALDPGAGKMYWTDRTTAKIQRANLDGSGMEDLVTTGPERPVGLALDLRGGKMYWTDFVASKIQRANLDGSGVEDLVTTGLDRPGGLALDPDGGKMYWTDTWTDKIQRANLDGSGVEDLVTTGLDRPGGLALDPDGGKMYWTDTWTDKIQRANLDGSGVEDLVTTGLLAPAGVALDTGGLRSLEGTASTLYFPDYVVGSGWSVQLALGNIDAAAAAEVVVEVHDQGGAPIRDLFDTGSAFEIPPLGSRVLRSTGEGSLRRGWIQVRNPSTTVRGLLTYRHAETGVEVGVEPVRPGKRFALFVEDSADVGTGLAIFKPQPDAGVEFDIRDQAGGNPLQEVLTLGDFQQRAGTLPEWFEGAGGEFLGDFRGLLFLRAMDGASFAPLGLRGGKRSGSLSAVPVIPLPEPGGGKIYWTDDETGKIQRANLDGSEVEDLVTTGLSSTFGLALDAGGGKMYWTDRGTDKIQRANLDGSGVEDLVTTGLLAPSGLALDRVGGKMYWTDWGTDKIQRANLDGGGVEDLVTTGLFGPFDLALDPGGGKVYWTALGTGKIQRANLDGSGVEDLVTGLFGPFGLALDPGGGKMYWTAQGTDKIQRANLDGSGVEDLITGLFEPFGLALDPGGGKMYWTDWRTGKIQRANLDGSGAEDLVTGLGVPRGVALYLGGPRVIDDGGGPVLPRPTVTMSASPDSIEPGQSATLTWSSANARSASITPRIGTVPTSGTRRVFPTQTTTYRITVRSADGRTATDTAKVTVTAAPKPAAPAVSVENTTLTITFSDSFGPGETKAYDLQLRTKKTPREPWTQDCVPVTNPMSAAPADTVFIVIEGFRPRTAYEVRYRHRNSSLCGGGSPGEWSEIGEGMTGAAGKPPAPTISSVSGDNTALNVQFPDSFGAGETKAYDGQFRTKTPRGPWLEGCTTITNESPREQLAGIVFVTLSGFTPGTTYEIRYRHRNSSQCGSGSPGEWSDIGEGTPGS